MARSVVCEWCGAAFEPAARGPVAKYCRGSHRQRAYEARRLAEQTAVPAVVESAELSGALARLADAVGGAGSLDTAALNVLSAAGFEVPAGSRPRVKKKPVGASSGRVRRVGPWKVLLDTGAGPQAWTSHRTESAAGRMSAELARSWARRQLPAVADRATWSVSHDPANEYGPGLGAERARLLAARVVIDPNAAEGVIYRYRSEPIEWSKLRRHRVTRHSDGFSEDLGARVGHWGGQVEVYETNPGSDVPAARHRYVHDLIADALGLFERRSQQPGRAALVEGASEFVVEVIEPLGVTWELSAEAVRDWVLAAGLADVVAEPVKA